MKTVLSPHLSPTSCLDVDSAAAQDLAWLPYAVRFKLDECGLAISLARWQQLSLRERVALVHAPLQPGAGGFRPLALAGGARPDACRRPGAEATLQPGDLAFLHGGDVQHWLSRSTPFARYVLGKMARRKAVHAAA
jgi:hypothetical protein